MGKGMRVNPDCRNASNPYHECVDYCSRRIAEVKASKKTEEEKEVVQVNPDCRNGRIAEVKASKKTEETELVQVNPDCRNASSFGYFSRIMADVKASKKREETEAVKDGRERAEALSSDSCASVGAYRVRQNVASTLRRILDKHGDIAANSRLESTSMRACYLESLCSVVQELQSTGIKQLTKSKLKEMLAVVNDVESAEIDVSWLLNALSDIEEAVEEHDAAEIEKSECDSDIESTRKELKSLRMDLARKEKAAAEATARVTEAKAQVTEASRHINERVRESFHWNGYMSTMWGIVEELHSKLLKDELV